MIRTIDCPKDAAKWLPRLKWRRVIGRILLSETIKSLKAKEIKEERTRQL